MADSVSRTDWLDRRIKFPPSTRFSDTMLPSARHGASKVHDHGEEAPLS